MNAPSPAATATVAYEGHLRTTCTHAKSDQAIITDAPADNHGKGEAFSPTDLLATSLAACILTTVAIKLESDGVDFAGATAEVIKVMGGPPRKVTTIRTVIRVPARGFDPAQRELISKVVRACPVGRSLHPDLEQDTAIVFGDDNA